jgi:hypothetical protein
VGDRGCFTCGLVRVTCDSMYEHKWRIRDQGVTHQGLHNQVGNLIIKQQSIQLAGPWGMQMMTTTSTHSRANMLGGCSFYRPATRVSSWPAGV